MADFLTSSIREAARCSTTSIKPNAAYLHCTSRKFYNRIRYRVGILSYFSAIVCPWLNFGLPPWCSQVVWCHWGEIEPFSATLAATISLNPYTLGWQAIDKKQFIKLIDFHQNSAIFHLVFLHEVRKLWSTCFSNRTETVLATPKFQQTAQPG